MPHKASGPGAQDLTPEGPNGSSPSTSRGSSPPGKGPHDGDWSQPTRTWRRWTSRGGACCSWRSRSWKIWKTSRFWRSWRWRRAVSTLTISMSWPPSISRISRDGSMPPTWSRLWISRSLRTFCGASWTRPSSRTTPCGGSSRWRDVSSGRPRPACPWRCVWYGQRPRTCRRPVPWRLTFRHGASTPWRPGPLTPAAESLWRRTPRRPDPRGRGGRWPTGPSGRV